MQQQQQTQQYFNQNALDWQRKASHIGHNVIENRHLAVFEILKEQKHRGTLLDVGCGTGQLCIEASQKGWKAIGVDFAEAMVQQCKKNNTDAKANADFHAASIFDFPLTPDSVDVLSAQGFIEYISLQQLDDFLALVSKVLKVGGAIALGSRNRLFNLHAMNKFTQIELDLNTTSSLLQESIILQTSETQEIAMKALEAMQANYPQPQDHPQTGIHVDTRYQFSPADLIHKMRKHGLKASRIFPVHYHALPIRMMKEEGISSLHEQIAERMSKNFISSHSLVPYSSSYVIEAIKQS